MRYSFFNVASTLAHVAWFSLTMYLLLSRNQHIDHRRRLGDSWYTYDRANNTVQIHAHVLGFDHHHEAPTPPLLRPHEDPETKFLESMHNEDFSLEARSPEARQRIANSLTYDQKQRVNWIINWRLKRAGIHTTWKHPKAVLDVDTITANHLHIKEDTHVNGFLTASAIDVVTIEPDH